MKTVLAFATALALISNAQAGTLAAPGAGDLHLPGEKVGIPTVGSEISARYASLECGGHPACVQLNAEAPGPKPESAEAVTKEVPLPAAAWLFGSALVGFVMAANRRRI